MNPLLVIGIAAIAGAAIWRRREIRADAKTAAAGSTTAPPSS